jgi:hypothetical protein
VCKASEWDYEDRIEGVREEVSFAPANGTTRTESRGLERR